MSRRFKGRPMDGLPGRLPAGERVLWQSAPDFKALAVQAFRLRIIAAYLTLLVVCRFALVLSGHGLVFALISGAWGVTLASACTGLFAAFAWLITRTTVYTLTDKRVVITYGMALPKSLNLPLAKIEAVDLRRQGRTGDIAFRIAPERRLSFLLLWPHVRAGAQGRAQPVLRCIPDAGQAAELLGLALTQLPAAPMPAPRAMAEAA